MTGKTLKPLTPVFGPIGQLGTLFLPEILPTVQASGILLDRLLEFRQPELSLFFHTVCHSLGDSLYAFFKSCAAKDHGLSGIWLREREHMLFGERMSGLAARECCRTDDIRECFTRYYLTNECQKAFAKVIGPQIASEFKEEDVTDCRCVVIAAAHAAMAQITTECVGELDRTTHPLDDHDTARLNDLWWKLLRQPAFD